MWCGMAWYGMHVRVYIHVYIYAYISCMHSWPLTSSTDSSIRGTCQLPMFKTGIGHNGPDFNFHVTPNRVAMVFRGTPL